MKKVFFWTISVLAVISCNKNQQESQNPFEGYILSTFDVDEISIENGSSEGTSSNEQDTKMTASESSGTHTFTWENGDQFSMFGFLAKKNTVINRVYNFSANRFVYNASAPQDNHWSGYVPDIKSEYGEDSGYLLPEFAIYPAVTVEDYTVRTQTLGTGTVMYYIDTVTPLSLSLPTTQDGSGWKYCYFFSATPTLTAAYNNPAGGGIAFSLAHSLIRLVVNSSKDINQITLTASEARSLVGGNVKLQCSYNSNSNDHSMFIMSGCNTKTLTVYNDGAPLGNDIYMAVREVQSIYNSTPVNYTFVFTTTDGYTCTKTFHPTAEPAAGKRVIRLNLTISDGEWSAAS